MARIDRSAFVKLQIVQEASKQFLERGYSLTTISRIAKALDMSPGNLTYHYPTKEHLLAELVGLLCSFQWNVMKKEADDGTSSIMAICLELAVMASACEQNEVIRDFFLSAYTSPMCLAIIRENDAKRAMQVFAEYRSDWTAEQFAEAEILCSGIEYATMMKAGTDVPLETRAAGALNNILGLYNIPADVRQVKTKRVFAMDYQNLGLRILKDFRQFVEAANDQAILELLKRQIPMEA